VPARPGPRPSIVRVPKGALRGRPPTWSPARGRTPWGQRRGKSCGVNAQDFTDSSDRVWDPPNLSHLKVVQQHGGPKSGEALRPTRRAPRGPRLGPHRAAKNGESQTRVLAQGVGLSPGPTPDRHGNKKGIRTFRKHCYLLVQAARRSLANGDDFTRCLPLYTLLDAGAGSKVHPFRPRGCRLTVPPPRERTWGLPGVPRPDLSQQSERRSNTLLHRILPQSCRIFAIIRPRRR
jgi:hypothetical protein